MFYRERKTRNMSSHADAGLAMVLVVGSVPGMRWGVIFVRKKIGLAVTLLRCLLGKEEFIE